MKVLITAGPTRESIDPVRFVSNRSSGKMGYSLAAAAVQNGYEVTLISGPVNLEPIQGVDLIQVETAAEMAAAVHKFAKFANLIIMAAAVADYRAKSQFQHKIKKSDGVLVLEFERTEDILATLGKNKGENCLVGFAAETEDLLANAERKLQQKNLDWIVANDVSKPDRGFGIENNAVTMLSSTGKKIEFTLQSKQQLAGKILAEIIREIKL